MFDVNDLKRINDWHGHQEGDRALISAAGFIQDAFGKAGMCFWTGGDESVVFLENSSPEQVNAALSKMKERISMEQTAESPLSIAAGYAIRKEGETVVRMVRRADAKMYEEKQHMKAERDG